MRKRERGPGSSEVQMSNYLTYVRHEINFYGVKGGDKSHMTKNGELMNGSKNNLHGTDHRFSVQ